jgi:hypothetical protein
MDQKTKDEIKIFYISFFSLVWKLIKLFFYWFIVIFIGMIYLLIIGIIEFFLIFPKSLIDHIKFNQKSIIFYITLESHNFFEKIKNRLNK